MDDIQKSLFGGISNFIILILSVGFLGIGMLKLVAFPDIKDMFQFWKFPMWSMYAIGIIEVVMAVGLLIKEYRFMVSLGIILLMIGAIVVHLYFGQPSYIYGPIIIIILASALGFATQKMKP